jgi:hypothetical protein
LGLDNRASFEKDGFREAGTEVLVPMYIVRGIDNPAPELRRSAHKTITCTDAASSAGGNGQLTRD